MTEADAADENVVLLRLKDFTEETNVANGFFSTYKPDVIMSKLFEKLPQIQEIFPSSSLDHKTTISKTNWRVNIEVRKQIN